MINPSLESWDFLFLAEKKSLQKKKVKKKTKVTVFEHTDQLSVVHKTPPHSPRVQSFWAGKLVNSEALQLVESPVEHTTTRVWVLKTQKSMIKCVLSAIDIEQKKTKFLQLDNKNCTKHFNIFQHHTVKVGKDTFMIPFFFKL